LKSIAILTAQFYDFDGNRIYFGGAERYLVDLVKFLQYMDYQVEVFQAGNYKWTRVYDGIEFKSIDKPASMCDFFPDLNIEFHKQSRNFDYVLYFCFNLCYPQANPNSAAISHGVWWDCDIHSWYRTNRWYSIIEQCLQGPELIVSVDTNTINWVRACYPNLVQKLRYIPNYVNTSIFKPAPKKNGNFTVLYPRSLTIGRGWKDTQLAAGTLLQKYWDMEFYFVGRGTEADEQYMQEWANNSSRVRYDFFDMKEMPEIYHQADLVLIPTKHSEGTSLSALEALASGKPVVAGAVGGINDLIIDNYNGFLINNINTELITQKVEELYFHQNMLVPIRERARQTAFAFSKNRWEESWGRLLEQIYPL